MLKKYLEILNKESEVYIRVKARPGAAKTIVRQVMADETIKIDIAASPVKGKANIELIKFLAKSFVVDKENVNILSGGGDRIKLVKITK